MILVVAALAGAGCGSSSALREAHPRHGTPQAESQLIAKADVICAQLNSQLGPANGNADPSHIARSAPKHAALEKAALSQLATLMPPASLARDWHKIISYRTTLAEELAKLGRYAKANNTRAIRALATSKERLHKQLTETATHAGFKDCATIGPRSAHQPTQPPLNHGLPTHQPI